MRVLGYLLQLALWCGISGSGAGQSCVFTTSSVVSSRGKLNTPTICVITLSLHQITWLASWGSGGGLLWCGWPLQSLGNGPVALWWRVVCCPPCRAKDAPSFSLPEMALGWIVFFTAQMLECSTAVSFEEILLIGNTFFLGHAIINMGSELFGNGLYCGSFAALLELGSVT